jgi:hypothetical protein
MREICETCGAAGVTVPPMSKPPAPPMANRSWYLPADVADALAAAVEDIHFTTRRPKHEVIAAAVAVALEHRPEILARLNRDAAA